ncbi:hypothetical protein H2248_006605 [Termitomyces sp. 'cryptogamus']|nr:hypothetical protein H2248_006605 [Termitomyces sp. 'cryptogamus']
MQVTISLLPSSLSLVHIPRSRLPHLSHPILRQVLRPDPTFLNITCNEFELSLFADESVLEDFEPIARKDRLKQRARHSSNSGRVSRSREIEPVEVSYERWCVLQVDSHNDQLDTSGARVNEVSAPLAAAGISILYQSSYMSDFILVKESRLQETMSLLAEAGFEIFSSASESASSPIVSPRQAFSSSIHDFRPDSVLSSSLTRVRNGTDPTGVKLDFISVWDDHQKPFDGPTPPSDHKAPRKKSTSPNAGDVQLLSSDLACVGLSEELGADHWGLKIVKLVAFPELISSPAPPPYVPRVSISSPVIQSALFPLVKSPTSLFDLSPPVFSRKRSSSPTGTESSASSSEDDGYFSHSPQTKSSLSVVTMASRSQTDLRDLSPNVSSPFKHRSRHIMQPFSPLSSTSCNKIIAPDPVTPSVKGSRIPFFSYTRTAEGSSLTADVYILSALFPPPERHMIICSGELDAADNRLNGPHPLDDLLSNDDASEGSDPDGSILSCLQIDLQRFGLDKYGLVNRFSKVLEQNKINHMYSSTFKTANLLVDKKHARRAQALLCNC